MSESDQTPVSNTEEEEQPGLTDEDLDDVAGGADSLEAAALIGSWG
jgi:acyl carrier protein